MFCSFSVDFNAFINNLKFLLIGILLITFQKKPIRLATKFYKQTNTSLPNFNTPQNYHLLTWIIWFMWAMIAFFNKLSFAGYYVVKVFQYSMMYLFAYNVYSIHCTLHCIYGSHFLCWFNYKYFDYIDIWVWPSTSLTFFVIILHVKLDLRSFNDNPE